MSRIGVVVIGRNEGERLARCLRSVVGPQRAVIYVDSASQDDSVKRAREHGVAVLELDPAVPLCAARARNAGFRELLAREPGLEFVQFVDGDCELAPGWLEAGVQGLHTSPRTGAVFGRLRERERDLSWYNRLCDQEWNTPAGPAEHFPGNVLLRSAVLREVGGYDAGLIAGEEPELSVRVRRAGWGIVRLPCEMGWHDAAMTRFGQWLRRAFRTGHATAQLHALHGAPPERAFAREVASALFWGGIWPGVVLGLATRAPLWGLAALGAYPLLVVRIFRRRRRLGYAAGDALLYAGFCALAKFPQLAGAVRFWIGRLGRQPARLIEYKG